MGNPPQAQMPSTIILLLLDKRFPLRGRSGVKATRPSPDGQLLLKKPQQLPISLMSPFCNLTIVLSDDSVVSCESSLLSQICHVIIVVLSFRRVKRCKKLQFVHKQYLYVLGVLSEVTQLHYLQLE